MEPLPIQYRKNGYRFTQVSRQDDIAIYAQHSQVDNRVIYWEVFRVQKNKAWTSSKGVQVAAKESTPGNEEWGVLGWTYTNLPDAEERFMKLLAKEQAKCPKTAIPDSSESILANHSIQTISK